MDNRKIAIIVVIFIACMFGIIALMGISSHIPLLRRPLTFIFALVLVVFVIIFFTVIAKRR